MFICTGPSNKTNTAIKFKQTMVGGNRDESNNHETDQQVLPPFSAKKIRQQCKLRNIHVYTWFYLRI